MSDDQLLAEMAAKQRRLGMIMWLASGATLLGCLILFLQVRSVMLFPLALVLSGGFAGLARSAQRKAHFAKDGDSTDDLDQDF